MVAWEGSVSQNLEIRVTAAQTPAPYHFASENGTCTSPATLAMNVGKSQSSGSILLPDRNAGANWQMVGMLSAGGIPNRITVCATVIPISGGEDDT